VRVIIVCAARCTRMRRFWTYGPTFPYRDYERIDRHSGAKTRSPLHFYGDWSLFAAFSRMVKGGTCLGFT